MRLDQVFTLEYGKPLGKEFRKSDGAYEAYGANGPIARASKYLVQGPCVIVGRKGSAGEITYVDGNVWPLDVTYYVKHDSKQSELRFLFYILKSLNLKQFVRGVKPGLNRNDVYALSVPFPPLEKQREIVKKLDRAFEEIDLLDSNLSLKEEKYEELLQSVLSAALTPNSISQRPKNFLAKQEQIQSWQKVSLKEICDVDWGNTKLTKSSYVENGTFLAVSASGADGFIDHYEHEANVPVLSAIGAQCGRMFFPGARFTSIKNTITLTPKEHVSDGKFLYYLLTHVELPQRGAGQPFISKGDIEAFQVTVPSSPDKQREIVAILDLAFGLVDKLRSQSKNENLLVSELRQSILQECFSTKEDSV